MRDIFVFGSNLAGRHGRGAALEAYRDWGARFGVGEGLTGNAYAIPTKTRSLDPIPLQLVRDNIYVFVEYANNHSDMRFLVTPVGCGLAGHSKFAVASAFNQAMQEYGVRHNNIVFTHHWLSEEEWWN
jgi:hypothetical protein